MHHKKQEQKHENIGPQGIPSHHLEGGIPPLLFLVHGGPEGPAAGAKRPHAAEGREGERSETVVTEATH